jgi:DNA-binding transcriptional LysR family regulator
MTQPPLSRAIRQLETDLGTVLLHRSAAGVTLTAARECIHAVMWNDSIGLAPLTPQVHELPEEVTTVRLADMPPSRLVVAWNRGDANPLIRSLIQMATAAFRAG